MPVPVIIERCHRRVAVSMEHPVGDVAEKLSSRPYPSVPSWIPNQKCGTWVNPRPPLATIESIKIERDRCGRVVDSRIGGERVERKHDGRHHLRQLLDRLEMCGEHAGLLRGQLAL